MDKRNIKDLDLEQLKSLMKELGQPAFRAKQVHQWVWERHASSFQDMSNLPKTLREELDERYTLLSLSIYTEQKSSDGTKKYLLAMADGTTVESVGIPSSDGTRLTVCFSTQAGCGMGCVFCATGLGGFTRNLNPYEMFDQVITVQNDFKIRVSNVVAMGQGEPFANYDNVIAALKLMNQPETLGIGARHITVSTCGILPGIEKFTLEDEQFTLAVSLHSAIQKTRNMLMPGVKKYDLLALHEELKAYGDITKRRPTLEYAPIDGINDDDEHLDALIDFCQGMLCHVNLIPLNPVENLDDPTQMMPSKRLQTFESALKRHGIEVSVRSSRGGDIDGACGQLRQKTIKQ